MAGYTPYGGVLALWKCKDPIVCICGGAGTGKSVGALHKAFIYASNHDGCRVLLCRATRSSMSESTLATLERFVLPPNAPWVINANRSHRTCYQLPNGSEMAVIGLDTPERIMSSEYQFIMVDEATELDQDQFDMLCSRLRAGVVPYRQIVLCCNPAYEQHWIKQRELAGKLTMIVSTHSDNPSLDAAYMNTLKNLTGHRRRRLLLGEWCSAEGAVYEDVNEFAFVEPPAINPQGTLYGGLDFGWADPKAFVLGTYYQSTAGRLCYVSDELYMRTTSIDDFAKAIKDILKGRECTIFADPSNPEHISALQLHGLQVVKAKNDVTYGIGVVNSMARDGTLFISEGLTKLKEEAGAHVWHPDISDKPKNDDYHHCLDALRYLCASVRYFNL